MTQFLFLPFLRSDPMSADLSPISLSHQLLRLSDYDSSESQVCFSQNQVCFVLFVDAWLEIFILIRRESLLSVEMVGNLFWFIRRHDSVNLVWNRFLLRIKWLEFCFLRRFLSTDLVSNRFWIWFWYS